MKSTVETTASPSVNRYTAASSLDSMPTSKFGSDEAGRDLSASDRTVGLIFAAQPHVRESPVRVFFLPNSIFIPFMDATSFINGEVASYIDEKS